MIGLHADFEIGNSSDSWELPMKGKISQMKVKRIMDIVIGLVAIILASVPMAIIVAIIRRYTKDTAIFSQQRIGKNGRTFTIYKFRTLSTTHSQEDVFFDQEQVIPFGNFFFKYSIKFHDQPYKNII